MSELLSWEAPEFTHRPKTASWYWGSMIIATTMVGIAAWQGNLLFGIFTVIAELLVLAWSGEKPKNLRFSIDSDGISIGTHTRYQVSDIAAFSVADGAVDDFHTIAIYFHKRLQPRVRILIPGNALDRARERLGALFPEAEHKPSFAESLEEFLGF